MLEMTMARRLVLGAILAAAGVTGAAAADKDEPPRTSPYVEAFAKCRAIAAAADRAGCYDTAYDAFVGARARKDVVVMDREGVREARRGLFGFSLPRLPFFGGGGDNDPDTPKELDSTIKAIGSAGRGLYRLRLADDAIWETTDELSGVPKVGGAVHIRRASLGSYLLTLGRGRAVRAIRVQ